MRIDRYEVLGEIARGGMGAVFRARDSERGGEVAIKVLLTAGATDDRGRRRFQREAETIARLDHPGIVPALGWGEDRGRLYMVLELVPGESLADRLEQRGPLEPREAATTIRTVARALEHAHQRGVLHRDLKPGNVLLDPDRGPLLTDFGLAKEFDAGRSALSRSGLALGTPGFWPPEQAVGDLAAIGPTSDVYALGATLYACLTGGPPLDDDSLSGAVVAAVSVRPEPTGVDPRLDRICLRCLEKAPDRRIPSAAALADALDVYLAGGDPEPVRRGSRRALVAALGVLGGVALLVGLAGVFLALRDRGSAQVTKGAPKPGRKANAEGVTHFRAGRFAEALACFDRSLATAPDEATVLYNRGMCRMRVDDLEGALADFQRASALAPGQEKPALAEGELHNRLEHWEEGLASFERVIATDPGNAQAYVGKGAALNGLGRYTESEAAYDRAVALGPELSNAWGGRAATRFELGRAASALRDYGQAIALDPNQADWWHGRAEVLAQLERWPEAEDDLTRVLALEGERVVPLLLRGNARFNRRPPDLPGFLRDYERALELLGPDDPQRPAIEDAVRTLRAQLRDR